MKVYILGLTILSILFLNASSVSAAQNCNFKQNLADIQAVKNSASPDTEEKELGLRKTTLSSILECLAASNDEVYEKVDASPFISKAGSLRSRMLYELKGSSFFYREMAKEVQGLDLPRSKLMAKEVLSWKRRHDESRERAIQYILWAENQELLSATEKRLSQLIKIFRGSAPKFLDRSHALVFSAKENNLRAQKTMENSESPVETWLFIKSSLESMQGAYESFMNITTEPR